MRHRIKGKKLNRSTKHRKALFKNQAATLILNGELKTTKTKAKLVKRLIDKLITTAKKGSLHSRRMIHAFFNRQDVTSKLVDGIAPKLSHRTSGYTKIVTLDSRRGDNTDMAKIEFVDKEALAQVTEAPKQPAKSKAKKTLNTKPIIKNTKSSKNTKS